MPLDLSKLQNLRSGANGCKTAGCVACMEQGRDHTRDHLIIYPDGKWGCLAFPGPEGDAHRKRIWALAGDGANRESFPQEQIAPKIEIERTWDASVLKRLVADHSYWVGRGVREDILIPLRGGVATEGTLKSRYVIPIFNSNGQIIGFSGRTLINAQIKHKHIGKSSTFVWGGLDEIRRTRQAFLVEGVGCRLSLDTHDVKNSIVMWGVNLSPAVLGFLISANVNDIRICTNNDVKHDVGQVAAQKCKVILDRFFNVGVAKIHLPLAKDFLDMDESQWDSWKNSLDIPSSSATLDSP